jgi:hypothetical protein
MDNNQNKFNEHLVYPHQAHEVKGMDLDEAAGDNEEESLGSKGRNAIPIHFMQFRMISNNSYK